MTLNEFFVAVLPTVIIIFLIFILCVFNRKRITLDVVLFSFISFFGAILLYLPLKNKAFSFVDSNFNWSGKICVILLGILCLFLFKKQLPLKKVGLTFKQKKKSIKPSLIFVIIYFSVIIIGGILTKALPNSISEEEILWNSSVIPDFAEEFFERGILLVLLNNFFEKKWFFLTIKIGLGFFLVTLLFGLEHAFFIDKTGGIGINYLHFLRTTCMSGLAFTWLKEKTGSLVFPTILHFGSELTITFLILYLH